MALTFGAGSVGPAASSTSASTSPLASGTGSAATTLHHHKVPSGTNPTKTATLDQVYDGFGEWGGVGGNVGGGWSGYTEGAYCPVWAGPEDPIVIGGGFPPVGWDWYYPGDIINVCF